MREGRPGAGTTGQILSIQLCVAALRLDRGLEVALHFANRVLHEVARQAFGSDAWHGHPSRFQVNAASPMLQTEAASLCVSCVWL